MKRNKSKSSQYLIPYIDFAFMVIIIFIALLSIAYFEPPGEGVGGEKKIHKKETEVIIKKIDSKIPPPLVSLEKQENVSILKQKIKDQEHKIKDMSLQLFQREEEIKELQEKIKLLDEEIESLKKQVSTQYQGKHEFTDLK